MNPIQYTRNNNYIPLIIFAISMGVLEAIVVVYIREIYYPEGFRFPLTELPPWLIIVEWIREISTLLMLGTVGWISGKTFLKRFSVFLFIFGIWDIIYYVGLKIFLDWPESLLTWDILFLIPITWVGPVLAPVLCSLLMILIALILDNLIANDKLKKIIPFEWILMIVGAATIFFTFTLDFGMILIRGDFLPKYFTLADNQEFLKILTTWEPTRFNWGIFVLGIGLICTGLFLVLKRVLNK